MFDADSSSRLKLLAAIFTVSAAFVVACTGGSTPNGPTNVGSGSSLSHVGHGMATAGTTNPNAGSLDEHGYIDGWFHGETVQLHYTKLFFCAEPPASGAPSNCEIGAGAEIDPRPGPIPTIYAIAAAGIQPDPSTLACPAGSPCLDHPAMIDISRIRPGVTSAPGLPHSHIVTERHGGWFNTVNIRVTNLDVWNQIAAAKTLEKVRELQADPNVGDKGLISQDTPTNIFFFIASWR
jgi:hypothetical protein